MAENIYDFLCLYGLTKVGMISIVEERTMPQTMNSSSCARGYQRHSKNTSHIKFTRSQPHRGGIQKAKNTMKQNDYHNHAITKK